MQPSQAQNDVLPVANLCVAKVEASALLPSQFGDFRIYAFSNTEDNKEHLAIVRGDVFGAHEVPTRVHSECLTGDVLGSLRCDCRAQLELALKRIGEAPRGIVLYLRQEGRGIGLTNKIRAYQLQEQGLDTIDANLALGFAADERRYDIAVSMLRALGVRSIALMTNNPDKVSQLERGGMKVARRLAHQAGHCAHNRHYLETKRIRSGHALDLALPLENLA